MLYGLFSLCVALGFARLWDIDKVRKWTLYSGTPIGRAGTFVTSSVMGVMMSKREVIKGG